MEYIDPKDFHFLPPPEDEPWAKAITQLNRDRELYDAGVALTKHVPTDAEMKAMGFKRRHGIWSIMFGKQAKKKKGKRKNEKGT